MLKSDLKLILSLSFLVVIQIRGLTADSSKDASLKELRIINGTDAIVNATKHQVSVRLRSEDIKSFGSGHKCGGSLISENVVLSAAHCFIDPDGSFQPDNNYIVVMGNLDRFEHNNNTLVFDVLKTIKTGKFFDMTLLTSDIVLIILNGTVPAQHPTVKPIRLNDAPLKNNTVCQTTGWGITEKNELSRMLRTVDVPIIDFNDCRNKTTYGSRLREGMICAGYLEGQRDACTADSGGPLVCDGVQAGITSWGNYCALPLNPGVYTDVAYFKDWILQEMANYSAHPVPDGVKGLSCSLFLIMCMLIINFFYDKIK